MAIALPILGIWTPASRIVFLLLAVWATVGSIAMLRLRGENLASAELRAALDAASIAITDGDGTIKHWSKGCERLYGWRADEALERNKYALLDSRDVRGEVATFDGTLPGERELIERRKDNMTINVIERQHVLTSARHSPSIALKIVDISDRVRAETALRESEARLATATAAHQIGVSHWDVPSGKIEWSEGSEQRLGFPVGGIGDVAQWQALIEPEDYVGVMDSIARATEHRAPGIGFRYRFRQPDGVLRTIEGTASCVYDAAGALETVVGANLDITERVEREAALQAREAQLRSVLEAAPSAMVVLDDSGTIIEFSPAAERLWGYESSAVIGQSVYTLAAPEEHERLRELVMHMAADGEHPAGPGPTAAIAIAHDGTRLSIEIYYGYARARAGNLITLFCRDVSERLAAERRQSELSAELAHVSRQSAMSEMATDLAHELNQPLSATTNFLAAARMLIAQGGDDERVADLLRMGEEQTQRSGEIIRRLRDFLSKRDMEMRIESIEATIGEAVELVLFGAALDDIRLVYRLDPLVDQVFVDRIQVQQVIVNLLRNAVDALRERPRNAREIIIASRAVGESMVEVEVSDSGPGLPEGLADQLYARFASSKGSTAMGIGLSISRRIIEAHGGSLVAENGAGGGATFRFTLPTVEESDK